MKNMRVTMKRKNLSNIPDYSLPVGYTLRLFQEGDQICWARVETAAGEFMNEEKALERFNGEFGGYLDEFKKRCLFIENEAGKVIGTTTAWYGSFEEVDDVIGRIHWVSIDPKYQSKGLSKPLLTEAMTIMGKYHTEAYLTSQTSSYKALNMYLDYGFEPLIQDETDEEAWKIVEEKLNRKI